ncbi:hypothetical protein [Methylocystis parvus]|uniref:hypothetical protein n=1 Tax=Methylocystis parvus TaxID=134 RepID=UPI003C7453D2
MTGDPMRLPVNTETVDQFAKAAQIGFGPGVGVALFVFTDDGKPGCLAFSATNVADADLYALLDDILARMNVEISMRAAVPSSTN